MPRLLQIARGPHVHQIKAAVREHDALLLCAGLSEHRSKLCTRQNFLSHGSSYRLSIRIERVGSVALIMSNTAQTDDAGPMSDGQRIHHLDGLRPSLVV